MEFEDILSSSASDKLLRDLRTSLLNSQRSHWREPLISPDKIRSVALKEFNQKTSIGADWVSFREIAQAPEEALIDLGNLIHQIFLNLAWPTQVHINLISLLGTVGSHPTVVESGPPVG